MPCALEVTSLKAFPTCTLEDQKLIVYFSSHFDLPGLRFQPAEAQCELPSQRGGRE